MSTEVLAPRRVKIFAAIVGGSAVLALGALGAAVHQEQVSGAGSATYLSNRGEMTLGNVASTTETEPSVLATEKAEPAVKATQFGES